MSFLEEIKRRKVFQVAAVYSVAAWLIVQIVDVVGEPFLLPGWFSRAVILLLAIGFPIAVIFTWIFDVTPDGVVKDQGALQSRGRRIEYVLIGLMAVAIGWLMYRDVARSPDLASENTIVVESQPALDASPEAMPNSVAVLPFEDMSANPEYAFFAPGMHDEILNQLAKLDSLNVIARTSVMQYAGAARPITEIARELNVETIMEGSVSYAEGRVAIRTQLIDAETGVHLWSESYNREFSDVFGIQADIATNVANALEAEFSLADQQRIAKRPTASLEAYSLYLKALGETPSDADAYLAEATAIDPEFAMAYALRAHNNAWNLLGISGASPSEAEEYEARVRNYAEQALSLDPTLGRAHAALGAIHYANWRATEAELAFNRAYQLSPDSNLALEYGRFKRYRGDYDEAIRLQLRAHELDPNNWSLYYQLGLSYNAGGYYDLADGIFRELSDADPGTGVLHMQIGRVAIHLGNMDEALRELDLAQTLWEGFQLNAFRIGQLILAYSQAGSTDDAVALFRRLQELANDEVVGDAIWARAYLAIGENSRALEHLQLAVSDRVSTDVPTLSELASNPWGNSALEEPEFRELLDGLWQ